MVVAIAEKVVVEGVEEEVEFLEDTASYIASVEEEELLVEIALEEESGTEEVLMEAFQVVAAVVVVEGLVVAIEAVELAYKGEEEEVAVGKVVDV